MAINPPKFIKKISEKAYNNRLKNMKELRDGYLDYLKSGGTVNIKFQQGNSKTGRYCYTISLIPVIDCANCSGCKQLCYDLRNVCWQPAVQNDRARNSALHKHDVFEYWKQIEANVIALGVKELRINVGGDLQYEDFVLLNEVAKRNSSCDFLFFTKNYSGINKFLSENEFAPNVKATISRWIGMECDNKFNLPESHVLFADGTTTAPEYGAKLCRGNCSECHIDGEGCWNLKKGESVVFNAH